MASVVDGLAALEQRRESLPETNTTGLAFLDSTTGGFKEGQVWLVVGTPGQGRSTLAAQWAWLLADHHHMSTQLVSRREPVERVSARIASLVAKVPLEHLWSSGLTDVDRERLRLVERRLEAAPLMVLGPGEVSIADADVPGLAAPAALVVDDAQVAGGMFPARVGALARAGVVVVLTMPPHLVVTGSGVDPKWADVADVVLDIDRPDLSERNSFRPGEADLHLIRNRWGPTRSESVAFQGHYARFVDGSWSQRPCRWLC